MLAIHRKQMRLDSKDQTGRAMYGLVRQYAGDLSRAYVRRGGKLVPLSSLPLLDFYNVVKTLPYRRDKKPVEVIGRPKVLLHGDVFTGLDCKKKAVLLGSWLRLNGRRIPGFQGWRFISVSTRPDKKIHHVFNQIKLNGRWLNLDGTYADYEPFQKKYVTKVEVLKP